MNNNFFHRQSYSYNKKRNDEIKYYYILVGYFKCRNIKLQNNNYTNKTAPLPT